MVEIASRARPLGPFAVIFGRMFLRRFNCWDVTLIFIKND